MSEPTPPPSPALTKVVPGLEEALALHAQGELGKAEARYERIIEACPSEFTAIHQLGVIQLQRGAFSTALAFLDRALAIHPRSALAHLNMGIALSNLGRPDEALSHFQYVLLLQPNHPEALLHSAVVLGGLSRHEEALARLDKLLATGVHLPEAHLNRGLALFQLQRAEEAIQSFDRLLDLEPENPTAHMNRGNAWVSLGRPAEALADYDRALALLPDSVDALINKSNALLDLRRATEALVCLASALALAPGHAGALMNRGSAHLALERYGEALADFEEVLARNPDSAEAHMNRGNALVSLERPLEALASYDRAIQINPTDLDLWVNRGNALTVVGRFEEALESYGRALEKLPDHVKALGNRSHALRCLARPLEALESCDRAVQLAPEDPEVHSHRGATLVNLKFNEESLISFRRLLELQPDHVDGLVNQSLALHNLGRHEEALKSLDHALEIRPSHAVAHSNKIFYLDYLSELGFAAHQEARTRFFELQAKRFAQTDLAYRNDRNPERKLVLGYVSADFKHHSAASCFGPILKRHDKSQFKIICYSGVVTEDEWTREFRLMADVWVKAAFLNDEELAARIRADEVDILIDLSGHSAGNRLLVLARKPAPIQVTAWGHGGGTGLPMVDYQFTDPVLIPASVRPLFPEASYDLPCFLPFEAPAKTPPIEKSTQVEQGIITFGCLNKLSKITLDNLELWAKILREVPASRLLLKDGPLDSVEEQTRLRAFFSERTIDPERIELRGYSSRYDHLATYNEVDIALDTSPQNGGVTTWEALWMGTPVLARLGDQLSSRASGAILHALGLGDWVCPDEATFVALAAQSGRGLVGLKRFQAEIRSRISASPAGNPELYTTAVEAAYREIWKKWLKGSSQPEDG